MKEYKFKIGGTEYAASVEEQENGSLQVTVNGKAYSVEVPEHKPAARPVVRPAAVAAPAPAAAPAAAPKAAPSAGSKVVTAPLPGTVTRFSVKVGDAVKAGDTVVVLEAMKMANDITAECDGTVKALLVSEGAQVQGGDALVELS